MVYSAFSFPYMAVYKTCKGNIEMDAELKPSVGYTLTEGELHLDPSEEKGAMELGLTKDYVVTFLQQGGMYCGAQTKLVK